MTPNELNYSPIEKLCLALVFSIQKMKHYFQAHVVRLISRANPIKFLMSKPVLSDRLASWYLQFQQFEIVYVPQKSVKGQALANFLADHPIPNDWELTDEFLDADAMLIEVQPPWKMYFDGAAHRGGAGAGVVFITSAGVVFITSQEEILPFSFTLKQCCSNNVAEYQALILGLEMAVDMKQLHLQVFGDSQLVINQLLGSYEEEATQALQEAYSGVCGSHQSGPKLHFRIKRMGYYWSIMEKDCLYYARKCDACQFHANFIHQPPEVLHPTIASCPFDAWGPDIVRPLPNSSGGHLYILAATDYLSKWAEAVAFKEVKKENVANFIRVNIIYHFGIPRYIITDNGKPFDNKLMNKICDLFDFMKRKSSMYHAAANGLAEAFNKTLCNLLKKVVSKSKRE
ncbi:uncharacterized protein [Solanum lycopersicum]|uniref:uncharacterized protein n=1 Tax=Solanum lycopersicum TaxID=4081 RepID=UPI0002BC975B